LVLKSEVFCMSLLLSLFLTGGLEVMLAAPDPASAQSPAPATKKNRRSSRKSLPKTPPPEMPPMEDLPLGAQDLLMTNMGVSRNPSSENPSRLSAPRPMDNYDFGAPPPRGENGEDADAPAAEDPEETWRRAVEEARQELREAEEEKQRQDNADSPVSPEQDATPRVIKARQTLRRLLEEGKAKRYREQPAEGQP
jgi:hypothetical protein